jgi:putative thiamine transport system ATP-binding protein
VRERNLGTTEKPERSLPAATANLQGLRLENVRLALPGRRLLALDLAVAPGAVATVMGPSGSGKSSLLAWLTGTLGPGITASGRVLLDGTDRTELPPERRRIGLLFQDALLFPHLTIAGNLTIALPLGGTRRERNERAEAALAEAGLAGFGRQDPATLSGGERARVALLRTLLSEPRALLLDEPFAKLDLPLRQSIREVVFAAIRARGLPALLVTHDPADAAAAGGAVVELGLQT